MHIFLAGVKRKKGLCSRIALDGATVSPHYPNVPATKSLFFKQGWPETVPGELWLKEYD
jgi:hypothetical protein